MEILGVRIDEVTMEKAVENAKNFLEEEKFHMIFTPNPEMLMVAKNDAEFSNILNSSDMNIPDGNGIVWASKRLKKPLSERVAGFDFIHKIFEFGKNKPISFYFLGSKPGVAEKAAENIEKNFNGVTIVGSHDGYFSMEEEKEIIRKINKTNPDVLLVALGAPKQERFIYKYREKLNCKIAIGVGGCFDVISGNVKRAPKLFIKLKLEWLYRGLTDLKRLKRLTAIPKFVRAVNKSR
ncbi:MAG: WecB/TagA/CpsF family glycosyltransferase [Clostridia bacterium]|nr:WecB/TagA/CpsF family glycosyltransferase [Clostridia bacterium]